MRDGTAPHGIAARHGGTAGRSFGLMLATILLAVAAYRWWHGSFPVATFAICAAGALAAAISLLRPALLDPAARAWLRFGDLLGMIVGPLVLAAIFFLLIAPVAIVARLFGRDELRLKRPTTASYWVARQPPQPQDNSFDRPF